MKPTRAALLLATIVTLIAWQIPQGQLLLYPFSLFATYAHEMGHGITTVLVGGDFVDLHMSANGSGYAQNIIPHSRIAQALVSAGGLVGPSVAGSGLLIISRFAPPKPLLFTIGGAMLLSVVLYTRGGFAPLFVLTAASLVLAVAFWLPRAVQQFFVQLMGVQLCIAVFRDIDYMFSSTAHLGHGQIAVSDSEAIAQALFLPYWFWGGLVALFSFAVLGLGLMVALRAPGTEPAEEESSPEAAD